MGGYLLTGRKMFLAGLNLYPCCRV